MNIIVLIMGMAVVTYLTRVTPVVLLGGKSFGKKFEKFLRLIPYTAMATLIFPGVLSVDSDLMIIGIAGGLTAVLLSWRRAPVTVVVIGAVIVDMLIYTMM